MDVVKAHNHANNGGFAVACTGGLNRFEKDFLREETRFSQALRQSSRFFFARYLIRPLIIEPEPLIL